MQIRLDAVSARHPAARKDAAASLRSLTLAFAQGEQAAVIGPSGAGKTSLLHVLACAMPPSSGTLHLDHKKPWALPRHQLQHLRGRLFLAPQVPPLPPRQRVVTAVLAARLPHISLWQSVRSLFYPTAIAEADAALARFDLSDKLFARVDRLSGGERQRVGLARALVAKASLLLVDEPLSALDPTRARQAIASLTEAARERGATLVSTLHHVEMALAYFPRIIGLREGELAFDLPAAEVTPELLRQLYSHHLDELTGLAPEAFDLPAAAALPAVMHCR
ncbi:MAG: ATP-binding cassette domain-containing protein [Pseudomonadota bacterium]